MDGRIVHKKQFLDQSYFRQLQSLILGQNMVWHFRDKDTRTPKTNNLNGYFSYNFYNKWAPNNNQNFEYVKELLNELHCACPIQVRANCNFRDKDTINSDWHNDYDFRYAKTAVLFLNNNNGKLCIKNSDKEFVFESKENEIVIFDNFLKHKVIYQTDVAKRYVINLNYFEDKYGDY